MIKIKILLSLILIFSFPLLSSEKVAPKDIIKVQGSLKNIEVEILWIENYLVEINSRERSIYDFKVNFSDLITNFATNETYKSEFQRNKKDLEVLEENVANWSHEARLKKEKISELVTILQETAKSYNEISRKQENAALAEEYSALAAKANTHLKKLKVIDVKVNAHIYSIKNVSEDTAKWKKFLITKIRKGLDRSLLNWQMNKIFTEPGKLLQSTLLSFKSVKEFADGYSWEGFYKANLRSLLIRLILSVFTLILIIKLTKKINTFFEKSSSSILDPNLAKIVQVIIDHKKTLLLISPLVFFLKGVGPISLDPYPSHVGLPIVIVLAILFWVNLGNPLVNLFANEINRSKKKKRIKKKKFSIGLFPVLVFIATRLTQSFFELDEDVISLLNSFLLAWISYKFFMLCLKFKIYTKRYQEENLAIFLKSTKVFIAAFAVALFVSALLEIIGFVNLGRSIQSVVLSNITFLGIGWLLYQGIGYFLSLRRKEKLKSKTSEKEIELIDFIRNALNVFFISAIFIIIIQSWHRAVFIFADFWDISLFSFGEFKLTIDKPIKILISFYIIRLVYILINYSLDSFILVKFNISKKYSSNVSSIIRYLFILIFLSLSAAILGMTYKNLIIFASALGVGIGFGLQNIVNNFLSGIILLFEQPIRIGDLIEVNGLFSKVKHIGIRSTIVESLDNSSIIIPNSEIISNKLINWTLNGNIIAIRCSVGVAYGTDTRLVSDILDTIAKEEGNILNEPAHQVWFTEFADSSLNFTLRAFINKPSEKYNIQSDILHTINMKLKENGVTIPFPQRDVHIFETKK